MSLTYSNLPVVFGFHASDSNGQGIISVTFYANLEFPPTPFPNYNEVQLGVHQAFDLPTTYLRNREVVEIARRPIFSKGGSTSSVCISMKPSFDLQLQMKLLRNGYDLPVIFLAVTLFCMHHELSC
ncbi:hypothetical protein DKX38_016207 [Salix brachista]|uniref:Uncharacterized protein n=1 Tax=Salix brachista TaxID=2182728 RepID=A0A5N5L7B4_9ROSI|nr:hypothetical protein DKX38_016207 [Salix brachista]